MKLELSAEMVEATESNPYPKIVFLKPHHFPCLMRYSRLISLGLNLVETLSGSK